MDLLSTNVRNLSLNPSQARGTNRQLPVYFFDALILNCFTTCRSWFSPVSQQSTGTVWSYWTNSNYANQNKQKKKLVWIWKGIGLPYNIGSACQTALLLEAIETIVNSDPHGKAVLVIHCFPLLGQLLKKNTSLFENLSPFEFLFLIAVLWPPCLFAWGRFVGSDPKLWLWMGSGSIFLPAWYLPQTALLHCVIF